MKKKTEEQKARKAASSVEHRMSQGSGSGGGGGGGGGGVVGAGGGASGGSSAPLLWKLRALVEHHDSLYSHHKVVTRARSKPKPKFSAATRKYVSAVPPTLRDALGDDDPHEKVITVAAVLFRLRPFLAVSGNLTLTRTRLMFVPNLQDPNVRKLGATTLQVDLPTVNIVGAHPIKARDLDRLVEEDIGLELQEDSPQRFLEVMYKPSSQNIVAPREAKKKGAPAVKEADADYCSLYFMISMDGMSVVRARLIQHLESGNAGGNADAPVLVLPKPKARQMYGGGHLVESVVPIPTPFDLLLLVPFLPPLFRSNKRWFQRYSSRVDGLSMTTLLRKVHDLAPIILFVQTTNRLRFGAYVGDALRVQSEHYGSDRLVLFRLDPAKETVAEPSLRPRSPSAPRSDASMFAAWPCELGIFVLLLSHPIPSFRHVEEFILLVGQ